MAEGAHDRHLHMWLENRGYTVTHESEEQRKGLISLPKIPLDTARTALQAMGLGYVDPKHFAVTHTIPSASYYTAPGIPLPDDTVSVSHMLIEPPLKEEDLQPLGLCLSSLGTLYDGGLRKHFFVDSRVSSPTPEDKTNVIYAWN